MRGDISQLKSQIVSRELKADEKYVISSDQRVSEDTVLQIFFLMTMLVLNLSLTCRYRS